MIAPAVPTEPCAHSREPCLFVRTARRAARTLRWNAAITTSRLRSRSHRAPARRERCRARAENAGSARAVARSESCKLRAQRPVSPTIVAASIDSLRDLAVVLLLDRSRVRNQFVYTMAAQPLLPLGQFPRRPHRQLRANRGESSSGPAHRASVVSELLDRSRAPRNGRSRATRRASSENRELRARIDHARCALCARCSTLRGQSTSCSRTSIRRSRIARGTLRHRRKSPRGRASSASSRMSRT